MKTVYIYGDDNGISWLEKGGSTTLSTTTGEWSSGVRFVQHPESKRDIYVTVGKGQISFTLEQSDGQQALKDGEVELTPTGGSNIELRADDDGGASAGQGTRWYSGYVQRK